MEKEQAFDTSSRTIYAYREMLIPKWLCSSYFLIIVKVSGMYTLVES